MHLRSLLRSNHNIYIEFPLLPVLDKQGGLKCDSISSLGKKRATSQMRSTICNVARKALYFCVPRQIPNSIVLLCSMTRYTSDMMAFLGVPQNVSGPLLYTHTGLPSSFLRSTVPGHWPHSPQPRYPQRPSSSHGHRGHRCWPSNLYG